MGSKDPQVAQSRLTEPLKYGGSLDKFEYTEVTPAVGRKYHDVQIRDLLKAENSSEVLKDMAYTSEHQINRLFQKAERAIDS